MRHIVAADTDAAAERAELHKKLFPPIRFHAEISADSMRWLRSQEHVSLSQALGLALVRGDVSLTEMFRLGPV